MLGLFRRAKPQTIKPEGLVDLGKRPVEEMYELIGKQDSSKAIDVRKISKLGDAIEYLTSLLEHTKLPQGVAESDKYNARDLLSILKDTGGTASDKQTPPVGSDVGERPALDLKAAVDTLWTYFETYTDSVYAKAHPSIVNAPPSQSNVYKAPGHSSVRGVLGPGSLRQDRPISSEAFEKGKDSIANAMVHAPVSAPKNFIRQPMRELVALGGRRKSRKLGSKFSRCVKSVRKTVRARPKSSKESAAIAICTKSVLQTRGLTMKRYRKGRLITQRRR